MSDFILPEVVTEILKKLPVKSLLRFRCVCREWCTLISNPTFTLSPSPSSSRTLVRHHSKLHCREIYTVYDNDTFNPENSTTITFPFHKESKYYRIVGYCNGVLCLSDDMFGCRDSIILWNPSVRRAITLPKARVVFDRVGPYMFALGFGFDLKNNDCKVVRVSYLLPDSEGVKVPPRVEVYSVSLGKWRKISNTKATNVKAIVTERFWSQAVVDGVVHWNAYVMNGGGEGARTPPYHNLVLKFDFGSEEFGELDLPWDLAYEPPMALLVATLGGSLSVVLYDEYLRSSKIDYTTSCTVWVMKGYGKVESWAKMYNIKLDTGLGMVLGMRRSGDMVLSTDNGELILYNCGNGRVSSLGIRGTKSSSFVDVYVESLMLLGKGEEVDGIEPGEEDHAEDGEGVEKDESWRRTMIMAHVMAFVFRM